MPDLGPDALVLSLKVRGNSVKEQHYPSATMFVIDKEVGPVLMKKMHHILDVKFVWAHTVYFLVLCALRWQLVQVAQLPQRDRANP